MRNRVVRSTREEIKRKLIALYSSSLDSDREVLDFDRDYDFFSTDESLVLKYSSNWFRPEKYSSQQIPNHNIKNYQSLCQDDEDTQKCPPQKQESLLKAEKAANLPRDLEILGRTPYQIGVDGEKFRVVAATLQKCNSPFVRRTFHFTSNGIVEAPEKKEELELERISTPVLKQQGKSIAPVPQQKFLRIRRFRVIKKDDLPVDKYVLPQRIRFTNGEKTRFLTVRIRPKNSGTTNLETVPLEIKSGGVPSKMEAIEEEGKAPEPKAASPVTRMEEVAEEGDRTDSSNTSEPDTLSLEEEMEEKIQEVSQMKQEESDTDEKRETGEGFSCENCGKSFPTYPSCAAHFRSHQRQACQLCSKRFSTVKLLREHVKLEHHERTKSGASEDRITTATSKFGRTRQVLNVAGLRSKYKML